MPLRGCGWCITLFTNRTELPYENRKSYGSLAVEI